MAKKGAREMVRLKSEYVDENGKKSFTVYCTTKNKRNTTEKLELFKYDPVPRKHCKFKESK